MTVLLAHLWRLVLMVLLLVGSAFCSGSETAFFNLSQRELRQLRESPHGVPKLVTALMRRPEQLLTTLLLGNMLVNVLFFSLASVLTVRLGRQVSPGVGAAVATGAFAALLLFGEMLPKSLAYSSSRSVTLAAAPIVYVAVRLLGPVLQGFDTWLVRPLLRLVWTQPKPTEVAEASVRQLRTLLRSSRHKGLLSPQESQLMVEVLEFGLLKARHVMVPRVDMLVCSIQTAPRRAAELMVRSGLDAMAVYGGHGDNIVGLVRLREAVLRPDEPLRAIVEPPVFIPEQKSIESLLALFRRTGHNLVLVVNEYGAVVGWVREDQVIDALFGTPAEGPAREVEQLGPMRYRLAGNLPLHDWAPMFDIDLADMRVATVGGLVVSLLGRLPKPGDVVRLENIEIQVEAVQRHRVQSVIITVGPLSGPEEGASR